APSARHGWVLPRLAQAVGRWAEGRASAAFAVVMDGTRATPPDYTGRIGIPPFSQLGKVMVLRIPTADSPSNHEQRWEVDEGSGSACYTRLSAGRYASLEGFPAERSWPEPLWLMEPAGRACGRLEDTQRAKRLIADDGVEMRSAHLSCFAWRDLAAGVELLQIARRRGASRGFPALFVA